MKLYLSAFKIGGSKQVLRQWALDTNKRVAYIPNALDASRIAIETRRKHIRDDLSQILSLDLVPEVFDLKVFFGKPDILEAKLDSYDMAWVSGGSPFVLRQAMHLSGFENAIVGRLQDKNFVYGGYSAGCCVLSPTLRPYAIIEDTNDHPYTEFQRTIWEGLGLVPFVYLPHYKSDHTASKKIDEELDFCVRNGLPYKAVKDGEVLIIDQRK